MKRAYIAIAVLILVGACDSQTPSAPVNTDAAAEKLVSHGYRKYTQKQFGSAHKAFLEAYFAYKDAGIEPIPRLYMGFSALTVQRLRGAPTYPISGGIFIIGDEAELTIGDDSDLLELSLRYLLAARALSTASNETDRETLDGLISCHEQHLSGNPADCELTQQVPGT